MHGEFASITRAECRWLQDDRSARTRYAVELHRQSHALKQREITRYAGLISSRAQADTQLSVTNANGRE